MRLQDKSVVVRALNREEVTVEGDRVCLQAGSCVSYVGLERTSYKSKVIWNFYFPSAGTTGAHSKIKVFLRLSFCEALAGLQPAYRFGWHRICASPASASRVWDF